MFVSQYQAMGVNNVGDTTYTKIFVGGLAWETQRETMKRHFEQFGEILEAVVITDKYTGRSKGYGFVTFKDPDSAMRACQDPSPVIDGRRANCNLASLGAQKNRPPAPSREKIAGTERFRPTTWSMVPLSYRGIAFPYSTYGIITMDMVGSRFHLITLVQLLGPLGFITVTILSMLLSMGRAVQPSWGLGFPAPKQSNTHICHSNPVASGHSRSRLRRFPLRLLP
ncbi:uncharacterized protein LOC131146051 isoform X4 [Malania oleifera]|uniref:uncharacterized protein LOC131146051 isoform X4 n=1 Tax=Malania oleifera TaxID=397392 RepID=UPI0025ADAAEC|nr:uncharacterized protein LOC131146051 isoform X4 [Malania oleifera]